MSMFFCPDCGRLIKRRIIAAVIGMVLGVIFARWYLA